MTSFRPHRLGSVVIGVLLLLLFLILPPVFTPFDYVAPEKPLSLTEDGNAALSRVLWIDRQLDVMVLALLLFVTSIGCATLLRSTRGEAS
jgi:NADH:ubiquinone oxidoreductase subunit 6 (subunit J)